MKPTRHHIKKILRVLLGTHGLLMYIENKGPPKAEIMHIENKGPPKAEDHSLPDVCKEKDESRTMSTEVLTRSSEV